jgi:N,N'-diacetyllegionaminate synthase
MKKTFIIAEAGVNHNGSVEIARQLIDAAVGAGADAIKFQTFKAEKIVSKSAGKASYQKTDKYDTESQYGMLKKLELDYSSFKKLYNYANKKQITFLSSPFDIESINFLNKLGLEIFKIPSGEITNLNFLREIARLKKQVILSTGMSTIGEIEFAINVLTENGTKRHMIAVLHCNTEYPTPVSDVNLKAMNTIKESMKVRIGYSDHTLGIEIPIAAVALGAEVIEKHFTLDKHLEGPDHVSSLIPDEFRNMVLAIRNIEKAMGDGIKKPSPSELKNKEIVRKSIVASQNIKKGEKFSEKNLTVKRPGTGLSPALWDSILGKTAHQNYSKDDLIIL